MTRSVRRRADPAKYLKLVIAGFVAAFLILPRIADPLNAAAKMRNAGTDCRVVSVVDGDTVRLYCPGRGLERARLTGFDTPELTTPLCLPEYTLALQAKWRLRTILWTADEISIVKQGRDRYDRQLIYLSADGKPVGRALIAEGLARRYNGGRRESWCG